MSGIDPSTTDPALARALRTRPPGWVAPGPRPKGADGRADLVPGAEEDLSFLAGDYRIFQQKRGHRWSLDDFVTAAVAIEAVRGRGLDISRAADIGCGIGSVLMMIAWAFPTATVRGVEAQDVSAALARRSLAYNGLEERCSVVNGDLRDPTALDGHGSFDLVTGTPPYIPLGHGLVSEKIQRGPCCFETRGGVEDYAATAARLLAPGGLFITCAGASPEQRAEDAARAAGLSVLGRVDVVPREGKSVLFRVVIAQASGDQAAPPRESPRSFVVRDREARLTAQMRAARELLGMPPLPG
jgi:tRNA1(Val) A37 N6-methylase TrmN6